MSSPPFTIRPFVPQDAAALAALFHASVRELGPRFYTTAQVAAWSPAPPDPARMASLAADGRLLLIAVDSDDAPLAYGNLEPDGHIDHLYAAPRAAGTGAAGAVLAALIAAAQAWGLARLHVEASEGAVGLFARHGFVRDHRRDLEIRGVVLHNYAMSRTVDPDTPPPRP
jgi:putative acetyltransferase